MPITNVAIIGAGAAGLVTAREFTRAGLRVTVFEQSDAVGGIWVYTAHTEDDPLGQQGVHIHTSLYASLRTNLPRDLMAYIDYPFDSSGGGADDWPRFPGHTRVREYLERFARHFNVNADIAFETRVTQVCGDDQGGWRVHVTEQGREQHRHFDAVVVCSGHYTAPRVPVLPGTSDFPGTQLHSHNYREPTRYHNRRVALLGTAASGADLSREIATVASEVLWCGELFDAVPDAQRRSGNLSRVPIIDALLPDGRLRLRGGAVTQPVDDLIYCTGYHYRYPFLDKSLLECDDSWVRGLYRDILHIDRPTLGFIGVPFRVVPFPLFEMQARWLARLFTGRFRPPSAMQMHAQTLAGIAELRGSGVKQRHFHQRTIDCYGYLDTLADECGAEPLPQWHRSLAAALLAHAQRHPGELRDRPFPHFGPTVVPVDSTAA